MARTILVRDRQVNGGATVNLGIKDDKGVSALVFAGVPSHDASQSVSVVWVLSDESVGDIVPLSQFEDGYLWNISDTITQHGPCVIAAYLRVTVGDELKWSSRAFRCDVVGLPNIGEATKIFTPTIIDQMYTEIQTHKSAMSQHTSDMLQVLSDTAAVRNATSAIKAETEGIRDAAQEARTGAEQSAERAAEDRADAQESATRASERADDAESSAAESERQAGIAQNNILNGVSTHNASPASHDDIREDARRIEAIARGRATAYVFDTYADMLAWLGDSANTDGLVRGDNLYIRDTGVKDYWWDGEAPQELEAEAPDLTDYYTRAQVDAMMPITLSRSAYDALSPEAGRVYNVWED